MSSAFPSIRMHLSLYPLSTKEHIWSGDSGAHFLQWALWHNADLFSSGGPPHCLGPVTFRSWNQSIPLLFSKNWVAPITQRGICEPTRWSPGDDHKDPRWRAGKQRELTNCTQEKWNQDSELNLMMVLQIGSWRAWGGKRHTPQQGVRVTSGQLCGCEKWPEDPI